MNGLTLSERIYSLLPIWAQDVAITVMGARLALQRYGVEYWSYKRRLPGIYSLPLDDAMSLQLDLLKSFLIFAKRRSPFYAELYKGFDPTSLRSLGDLKALPVIDKETLRQNAERIYTVPRFLAIEGHTGGTTGKSLVVRFTRGDMQRRMAELDYFRERFGARHRMRRATFSGKHLIPDRDEQKHVFWRTNYVLNQRFYSTFHLTWGNMGYYVENLNSYRPEIIDGFTSCIVDICKYVASSGGSLHFRPIAVFPTSEPLFPDQRQIIREVLGVEPRDQYASSEGAPFIFECREGSLHYALHTGVIETDSDGEALVTSFTTHGTPLIRYRIGDRIVVGNRRCSCGWDTPVIEAIEGRAIDYLYSRERGRIYSPNLANVVKQFPNSVIQTQFVQESPERIVVRLVVDKKRFDIESDAKVVLEQTRARLGRNIEVQVRVVDEIERAASGKTRFVVNETARF